MLNMVLKTLAGTFTGALEEVGCWGGGCRSLLFKYALLNLSKFIEIDKAKQFACHSQRAVQSIKLQNN
jgi:hypothetical protein